MIEDDRIIIYRFFSESNGNYVGSFKLDHKRILIFSFIENNKKIQLRIENKKKKATVRAVALQIFRDERKENLF